MCAHKARPPGIYKGHYLQELITRYAGGEEGLGTLPVPQLPDWCLEEEEENSGGEGEGSGGGRGEVERVARQKRREINNEVQYLHTMVYIPTCIRGRMDTFRIEGCS